MVAVLMRDDHGFDVGWRVAEGGEGGENDVVYVPLCRGTVNEKDTRR